MYGNRIIKSPYDMVALHPIPNRYIMTEQRDTYKLEIISGGVNLRTPTVIGNIVRLPRIGERFEFVAKPLDPRASVRYITTSPVKNLLLCPYHNTWWFETQNSKYSITKLEREETQ